MVWWMLAALGLTAVLTEGAVGAPWRSLTARLGERGARFGKCPQCVGFWCGALAGALAQHDLMHCVVLAFATSFVAYITAAVVAYLRPF